MSATTSESHAVVVANAPYIRPLHPLQAFLLAGTVPLFLCALLTDLTYYLSYEVQWKNFTSWLIIGGLVFAGFALLGALIGLIRAIGSKQRILICFLLLLVAWVLGFVDELLHAKDAWGSMPESLILSAIVAVLVVAATAVGFSTLSGGRVVR